MEDQPFDLILHGATSFVGRLISHYLYTNYKNCPAFRWAISGRSQDKLNSLLKSLGPEANVKTFVVDSLDNRALSDLVRSTNVVLSTVGPYAWYGESLLAACCESGTDYCDITGEITWLVAMKEKYERVARESGARILPCCGFDSIPSDLGVFVLQSEAIKQFGTPLNEVVMVLHAVKGGFSGGTIASLANVVQDARKSVRSRKLLGDPYALLAECGRFRYTITASARFEPMANTWVAPFLMSAINVPVVHWSNSLLEHRYGTEFRYDEVVRVKSRWSACCAAAALKMGVVMCTSSWLLWLATKLGLPEAGQGPKEEILRNGFFDVRFYGSNDLGTMRVRLRADGDPGYSSTARMAAEAAICLATDKSLALVGGFYSTAGLLNERLVARLQERSVINFEILK